MCEKQSTVLTLIGGPLDGETICGNGQSPFFIIGYAAQDGEIFLSPSEEGFDASEGFQKFAAVYAKQGETTYQFVEYNESSYKKWSFVTSSVNLGLNKEG